MVDSLNLGYTFMDENQAQPHLTFNDLINKNELTIQVSAIDQQNTPPGSPAEGQIYIVGTAGTGDWATHNNEVAIYRNAAWAFYIAFEGFLAYDQTGNQYLTFDGAVWNVFAGGGGGINNIVEDTTPQLGGDLDVNGQEIVSVSNGDITIHPNGTGVTNLKHEDATTSTTPVVAQFQRNTTGTAADNIGGQILFQAEDDAGNLDTVASILYQHTDVSSGVEVGKVIDRVYDAGAATDAITKTTFSNTLHNQNIMPDQSRFLAYRSAGDGSQNITEGAARTVIFSTEIIDTDSAYNTATGIHTVPTGMTGEWDYRAIVKFTSFSSGITKLNLRFTSSDNVILGVTINPYATMDVSGNLIVIASAILPMDALDTCKVEALFEDALGSDTIDITGTTVLSTLFQGRFLG